MTKLTRTQKNIINTMHRLRYPATINEIGETADISWVTVKSNLSILKKYDLVNFNIKKTQKTSRKYWFINYDIFE